jgi:hypothetical protein
MGVQLAKHDPERAIAWAESLTPEQGRDEVLSESLRTFATHDRARAAQWMRERAPDPTLDAGAARLAYEYSERNPAVALEMIGRIQSPEMFAKVHKLLTFHWKGLPDAQRAELTKKLAEIPAPGPVGADAASS